MNDKQILRDYLNVHLNNPEYNESGLPECLKHKRTGEIHYNNSGEIFIILAYFNSVNITIKFVDGTICYKRNYGNIINGKIKNPNTLKTTLIHNIGFIGEGKYSIKNNYNIHLCWKSMLERSYSERYKSTNPTYVNCTVYERWYNFQVFAEWYEKNYIENFVLDKDILVKGNKIYSPDTCCFVPQEINSLFTKCDSKRGLLPIGVIKNGNKYYARVNIYNKRIRSKILDTTTEAFNWYKFEKENHIKHQADVWTGRKIINGKIIPNFITENTYQAMINYQVEITD